MDSPTMHAILYDEFEHYNFEYTTTSPGANEF